MAAATWRIRGLRALAPVVALVVVSACGTDGGTITIGAPATTAATPETTAAAPSLPEATTAPSSSTTTDPGPVPPPTTRVLLSTMGIDVLTDIEQVLGFEEGGDNPCALEEGPIRDQPVLVDSLFRDSVSMQIGWGYSFCWGLAEPAGDIRLVGPSGAEVEADATGAILPGAPVGRYRVTGTAGGQAVAADVEVVPTTDARIFAVDEGAGTPGLEAELYVVGFPGRGTVPIAVYRGEERQELVGLFDAEVDAGGAGRIVVAGEPGSYDCIHAVADPARAIATGSYENEGTVQMELGFPLYASPCFGTI